MNYKYGKYESDNSLEMANYIRRLYGYSETGCAANDISGAENLMKEFFTAGFDSVVINDEEIRRGNAQIPEKVEEKILEIMPYYHRIFYNAGHCVVMEISRRRSLKRYGDFLSVFLQDGKVILHNLDESNKHVAENVIGYFLYGDGGDYTADWEA